MPIETVERFVYKTQSYKARPRTNNGVITQVLLEGPFESDDMSYGVVDFLSPEVTTRAVRGGLLSVRWYEAANWLTGHMDEVFPDFRVWHKDVRHTALPDYRVRVERLASGRRFVVVNLTTNEVVDSYSNRVQAWRRVEELNS